MPVSLGDSQDRVLSYGHRNRLWVLWTGNSGAESLGNFPELGGGRRKYEEALTRLLLCEGGCDCRRVRMGPPRS